MSATPTGAAKVPNPIRIGQIGIAGGIGGSHLNEQEKNPRFVTIAGMDINLENPNVKNNADKITAAGGKVYSRIEDLLADPAVEAVSIATPHFVHREQAELAFKAGKHVLCEKPMGVHPDDTKAMVAAGDAAQKVGAVQMQYVGFSSFLQLRDLLQQGVIGRVKEVFLNFLWWREESYYQRNTWAGRKKMGEKWNLDGVMFNQAVHYINQTLIFLASGPLPAVARVKNLEVALYRLHQTPTLEMEDLAFVTGTFDTPDAPRLTLAATTCARRETNTIEILGEHGRIFWNDNGTLLVNGQPAREFKNDNRPFDGASRIYDSFYDAIRTGVAPMTDFSQIARTTDFIVSVYERVAWHINPVPFSAAESVNNLAERVFAERKLPAQLSHKPEWA